MTAAPRVSVVLPVFDGARYLRPALDSVLAQTMTSFELLVMDDGSSDATPDILAEYARADPRVRAFSQTNAGQVPAMNALIGLASAPFIARMDADDVCHPTRFEKQLAFLDDNPRTTVVGSGIIAIDPHGLEIEESTRPLTDNDIRKLLHAGRSPFAHPTVMMRREDVLRIGGYRAQYAPSEDLDLWLRLEEAGASFANLVEPLLYYRTHPGSLSNAQSQKQARNGWQAWADACARRGMPEPERLPEVPIVSATEARRRFAVHALLAGRVRNARLLALAAVVNEPKDPRAWFTLGATCAGTWTSWVWRRRRR